MRRLRPTHAAQIACLFEVIAALSCREAEFKPPNHDQLILEARAALEKGDQQKALDLYSQSLTIQGTPYGYFERGKLHADMGDSAAAQADCNTGLKLQPDFPKLLWLQAELKKPPASRFKGKSARPPGGH